jgi:hypothetical protein
MTKKIIITTLLVTIFFFFSFLQHQKISALQSSIADMESKV